MEKILFTSVVCPFGGPGEGDSVGAELFHAQVTRAQGFFSPRQVIRCWAIDYIANNISAPFLLSADGQPSKREVWGVQIPENLWGFTGSRLRYDRELSSGGGTFLRLLSSLHACLMREDTRRAVTCE